MKQTDIIKLIAQQVFYLFDANDAGFLLPDAEVRLLADGHAKRRVILHEVFTAAKTQSLIDQKMELWDFVELIRNDFRSAFNNRNELLKLSKYAKDFVYPHEQEKFLLTYNFTINESLIQTTQPVVTHSIEAEKQEEARTPAEDDFIKDKSTPWYLKM